MAIFEITPTTETLANNTSVQGTYSTFTMIPDKGEKTVEDLEEHLYQCRRFTRLESMLEQDGPYETWTIE